MPTRDHLTRLRSAKCRQQLQAQAHLTTVGDNTVAVVRACFASCDNTFTTVADGTINVSQRRAVGASWRLCTASAVGQVGQGVHLHGGRKRHNRVSLRLSH
jgi:hypothetical protein